MLRWFITTAHMQSDLFYLLGFALLLICFNRVLFCDKDLHLFLTTVVTERKIKLCPACLSSVFLFHSKRLFFICLFFTVLSPPYVFSQCLPVLMLYPLFSPLLHLLLTSSHSPRFSNTTTVSHLATNSPPITGPSALQFLYVKRVRLFEKQVSAKVWGAEERWRGRERKAGKWWRGVVKGVK